MILSWKKFLPHISCCMKTNQSRRPKHHQQLQSLLSIQPKFLQENLRQHCVLQLDVPVLVPGHCSPPFTGAGLSQALVLDFDPDPQVLLHADQDPHAPHPPFNTTNLKIKRKMIKCHLDTAISITATSCLFVCMSRKKCYEMIFCLCFNTTLFQDSLLHHSEEVGYHKTSLLTWYSHSCSCSRLPIGPILHQSLYRRELTMIVV